MNTFLPAEVSRVTSNERKTKTKKGLLNAHIDIQTECKVLQFSKTGRFLRFLWRRPVHAHYYSVVPLIWLKGHLSKTAMIASSIWKQDKYLKYDCQLHLETKIKSSVTCSCGFIFSACIFFTSPANTASGSAVESMQFACGQKRGYPWKSLDSTQHIKTRNSLAQTSLETFQNHQASGVLALRDHHNKE